MTWNYFIINLHQSMRPGRDQTRDPWICGQICYRLRYGARYEILVLTAYIQKPPIKANADVSSGVWSKFWSSRLYLNFEYASSESAGDMPETSLLDIYNMYQNLICCLKSGPQIRVCNINYFLICQLKHMLCVLKRTVLMRQFVWAPKTYFKTDG